MEFVKFIANNYVMFFELIGILIILRISMHVSSRTKRYTIGTVILLFIAFVLQNVELYLHQFTGVEIWRFLLTAAKYSIYPFIIICILLVVIPHEFKLDTKWRILICLPAIISVPLYFTSQWSHLIMYFEVHYHGGYLSYWPYAIFAFYLTLFIVFTIVALRKYSRSNRIIALYIAIASVAGVALYIITDITDDYTGIITAALLLYFLFLYIHMASIDTLTGLLNRQSYYQDLKIRCKKFTAVISADMNELKVINDSKGHDEGDKAIKTVARILMDYSGSKGIAYRTGGDEFIILYVRTNEDEIKEIIAKMKEELSKTLYTCAFGYATCGMLDDIKQAIKTADNQMYVDKRNTKNITIR